MLNEIVKRFITRLSEKFNHQNKELTSSSSKLILILSIYMLIKYLARSRHQTFSIRQSLAETLGSSMLITTLLTQHSEELKRALLHILLPRFLLSEEEQQLIALEKIVNNNDVQRPKEIQAEMSRVLQAIQETKTNTMGRWREITSGKAIIPLLDRLSTLGTTKIPITSLKTILDMQPFASYPDVLKNKINTMITRILYQSHLGSEKEWLCYYIHGEPGTGKNHFIEHLAKNLNVGYYRVSLSNQSSADLLTLLESSKTRQANADLLTVLESSNTLHSNNSFLNWKPDLLSIALANNQVPKHNITILHIPHLDRILATDGRFHTPNNFSNLARGQHSQELFDQKGRIIASNIQNLFDSFKEKRAANDLKLPYEKVVIIGTGYQSRLQLSSSYAPHFESFSFNSINDDLKKEIVSNMLSEFFRKHRLTMNMLDYEMLNNFLDADETPGVYYIKIALQNYFNDRKAQHFCSQIDGAEEFKAKPINDYFPAVPLSQQLANEVFNNKHNRPESIQKHLEKLLVEYKDKFYQCQNNSQEKKQELESLEQRIMDLCQFKFCSLQININDYGDKLEKFLATYSEENRLRDELLDLTRAIIYNIEANKDLSAVKPRYFQGAPGVGKTHFVENLCRILGIPCHKVIATEVSRDSLYGDDNNSNNPLRPPHLHRSTRYNEPTSVQPIKIGILEKAWLIASQQKQCQNVVLLIDELDKNFNRNWQGWLLKFTEYSQKTFHSGYFGMKLPKRNIIIIATGNTPIQHPALNSRWTTVRFPAIDKHCKQLILRQHAAMFFEEEKLELTEEHQQYINHVCENDLHDGVRQATETIRLYANAQHMVNYFKGTFLETQVPSHNRQNSQKL